MPPFSSSIEHLVAELDRASGVLQNIALARARKDGDEGIADDTPPDVDAMTRSIEARLRESVAANVPLRLRTLTRAFGLTRFDVEVILFSLLPEVSERYASAYARLQQRGAARWPSVDLVLEALCSSYEERIASRARFMPHAPLLRHQIIELVTDPIDTAPALPSQLIKVDPRVAGYLFESDAVDPKIEAFTRLIAAPPEGGLILPSDLVARLERFIAQPDSFDSHAPIIYLEGP